MTLWQMMAVAALAVTMTSSSGVFFYRVTFALIFLQIYITYLWWSVGIYDKNHRKLNLPYTVCFLISLALIIATLYAPITFKRILFALALLFNYLPPFISNFRLKKKDWNFNLSPSMAERLGLFTIIAFGEAILGVINGASQAAKLNIEIWECFGLGILIIFSLWWIFFTLIADRQIENGFLTGQLMSLLYIPALASLGIIGATFTELLGNIENTYGMQLFLRELFGVSIFVFMISTFGISLFLSYPKEYAALRKQMSLTIISAAISLLLITFLLTKLSFLWFLVLIFCILVVVIITITRIWFIIEMKRQNQQVMAKRNED
jgi:low temperature requirement protein LtrA